MNGSYDQSSKFQLSHHPFNNVIVIQAPTWLQHCMVTWSKSMGKLEGKVASCSNNLLLPYFFLRSPLQSTRLVACAHSLPAICRTCLFAQYLHSTTTALSFGVALISTHPSAGLLASCPGPVTSPMTACCKRAVFQGHKAWSHEVLT